MAKHKRNFDALDDVETPPRFVEAHPAIFVLLMYTVVVALATVFLYELGQFQRNPDDARNIHAVLIFAGVMAIPFGVALYSAFRRPRLSHYMRER